LTFILFELLKKIKKQTRGQFVNGMNLGLTKKNYEINISILLIVSAFIHFSILFVFSLPDLNGFTHADKLFPKSDSNINTGRPRFIAANINQDDKRKVNEKTLLSDRDSQEKGYITKKKGETWYSGTTDINLSSEGNNQSGSASKGAKSSSNRLLFWDDSPLIMKFVELRNKLNNSNNAGERSAGSSLKIPDTSEISRQNSLYYSNSGQFSLNTVKFKHYEFAKRIVDKIRSNWYPPIMANVAIGGYGGGAVRVMAIPPQDVKTYFKLNRQGDVLDFGIIDSRGHKSLNESCLDSIKLSKNFGPVPSDISGSEILIPFIFIYR
jgi:hypothetical protein